jgi:hypothetical protein
VQPQDPQTQDVPSDTADRGHLRTEGPENLPSVRRCNAGVIDGNRKPVEVRLHVADGLLDPRLVLAERLFEFGIVRADDGE